MTLTAPLQPEPVICRGCTHDYVEHGSDLLGCLFGMEKIENTINFGCPCPGFELAAEPLDPSCRCGSPLSAHGEAGCTEVVGYDSPRDDASPVHCSCEEFRGAK